MVTIPINFPHLCLPGHLLKNAWLLCLLSVEDCSRGEVLFYVKKATAPQFRFAQATRHAVQAAVCHACLPSFGVSRLTPCRQAASPALSCGKEPGVIASTHRPQQKKPPLARAAILVPVTESARCALFIS